MGLGLLPTNALPQNSADLRRSVYHSVQGVWGGPDNQSCSPPNRCHERQQHCSTKLTSRRLAMPCHAVCSRPHLNNDRDGKQLSEI